MRTIEELELKLSEPSEQLIHDIKRSSATQNEARCTKSNIQKIKNIIISNILIN